MWQEKAKVVLQEKKLRVSNARVELLSFFIGHSNGHDLSAIQQYFSPAFDRVTIYRTLNTFTALGLLTKIHTISGKTYYVLHDYQSDLHPHLKCRCCDAILCLPTLPEDYLQQLKPLQIEEMPLLLEGVCKDCLNNQPD